MSHFAEVENGIVQRVIVAEQDFIDSGRVGDKSNWVQTSYNTKGGVHYAPNSSEPDGGTPLRKNYAAVGYIYDEDRDAFYEPQPYPSWILDEETCLWNAPEPWPTEATPPGEPGLYTWDESSLSWKL